MIEIDNDEMICLIVCLCLIDEHDGLNTEELFKKMVATKVVTARCIPGYLDFFLNTIESVFQDSKRKHLLEMKGGGEDLRFTLGSRGKVFLSQHPYCCFMRQMLDDL